MAERLKEVLSRRGENLKTYDLGDGKYRAVIGGGIAHYKDDPDNPEELWKDVDTTIIVSDRENWDWEVTTGKYHILIRADTTIAFGIDGHWVGFRYDGFGYLDWASKNHVILGTRQVVTPVVSENKITWTGIFGAGTSLEYVYTDHRLQTNLYIEQSARNWLGNNPPSSFGLSNQTSYLVGFAEMDWQNAYPAEDADGNTINWSNINEFIDSGVYWRHPLKDVIVNAMPIEYAKHDDLDPEEWVSLRYRFYKHNDKHYLLFGAHVLDLNAYPEGTINLDPTLTVQGTGVKDTFIDRSATTTNYGSALLFWCGYDGGVEHILRSLLEFAVDWGTDIPTGSTINSAVLSLLAQQYYGSSDTYTVSRLRRMDWVEGEATWNIYKTGSNWGTAGCGSTSTDYYTADAVGIAFSTTGWKNWTITNQVKSAQSSSINVAMRISGTKTSGTTNYKWYALSTNHSTSDSRPKLVIDYTEAVTRRRAGFMKVM